MQNDSNQLDGTDIAYLDFDIEISAGSGRDYPIAVVQSPAGEAQETMHFPFDELALDNRLKDLQIALLRSGGNRRQALSPEEQHVQGFGRELFNALLTGEVRSRYDISCREARQQGKGLRLKLRIQPPELAALPWEFLYDPRQAEYICLSLDTPLIRYLELPQPIQPLLITPPLRILGMIASPRDLPKLDIEREQQRLAAAIHDLQAKGLVTLTWLEGQTWYDLQRALRSGPWHIFHFIGHGSFDRPADEGVIALADESGAAHFLRATELGRLLADHHALRLVLLNACEGAQSSERDIFSSTAAILVRRGIPAVLAMQYDITDRAAIEFTRTFYEALATKLPIDAAVTEARKAISLAVTNSMEWGTPVLYMRAPQGIIFQISTPLHDGQPAAAPAQMATQPQAASKREPEEAARQQEVDALYSEAVRLLHRKEYQAALAKWREVQARDPQYLDTQQVQATATKQLAVRRWLIWSLPSLLIAVLGIYFTCSLGWIDICKAFPLNYYDFEDPTYNGRFNPAHWRIRDGSVGRIWQENGYLNIAQEGARTSERENVLIATQYEELPLNVPVFFSATIALSTPLGSDGGGGISIHTNTAIYGCQISVNNESSEQWIQWWREDADGQRREPLSQRIPLNTRDKWPICRSDFFPDQGRIDFYIDGEKVRSEQPVVIERLDMFALNAFTRLGSAGTLISHFDDVRIGPIKQ